MAHSKLTTLADRVGSPSATRGVIIAYDALGYSQPQLLGADILASSLKALVFSPDFFHGEPLSAEIFALSAEEKGKVFQKFSQGPGNFEQGVKNSLAILKDLQAEYPNIKNWAFHGYCWGGKIAAILSSQGTEYTVTGASHPGRIDPAEAKALKTPHISLLSGEDGSDEEAAAYAAALKESGQDVLYERFEDQVHGWMAARADLKDERVKAEFTRGYDLVSEFFDKYL